MFNVSKSGYYNWLVRGPSKRWCENEAISLAIRDIFKDSFESYGAPRIKVELLKKGHRVRSIPKVVCELQKDMPDQLKLVFCSFFASPKCAAFMNTIKNQ